ncbi:MAG: hypothetical protein O7G88_20045 [bacterium]|nr:hypothetical protein [bacterium]
MMTRLSHLIHRLPQLAHMLRTFLFDALRFFRLCLCPNPAIAAENLFLRKQLALYQERQVKPKPVTHGMDSGGAASAHSPNGEGQSDLGPGAHHQRIIDQTRSAGGSSSSPWRLAS